MSNIEVYSESVTDALQAVWSANEVIEWPHDTVGCLLVTIAALRGQLRQAHLDLASEVQYREHIQAQLPKGTNDDPPAL